MAQQTTSVTCFDAVSDDRSDVAERARALLETGDEAAFLDRLDL